MTSFIIVLVIILIVLAGLFKRVDIFLAFKEGAVEGLKTCVSIFPPLLFLSLSVSVISASGFFDVLSNLLEPLLSKVGFSSSLVPLSLIKPVSGSGSLALLSDIFARFGPDSPEGRAASVICAASETTFYTIAVYFGAAGIKRTAPTLPIALMGDFITIALSCILVRFF